MTQEEEKVVEKVMQGTSAPNVAYGMPDCSSNFVANQECIPSLFTRLILGHLLPSHDERRQCLGLHSLQQ